MKYCPVVFNYLYLDNPEGDIYLCPWMIPQKTCIGNLLKSDIETCYNSNFANELRESIKDQSFRFCRNEAGPHLQNNDLEDIPLEEYECRERNTYFPTNINMAYDFICNQHCITCRKSVYMPAKNYAAQMKAIHEKIAPCLNQAEHISASGHGDPFASKHMMDVLANIHPQNPNLRILLETNGVFFDEAHWERIKHFKDFNVELVITSNSMDPFVYKYISLGGNFEKLLHNIAFASELRKKGYLKKITHTLVIQDRNFREIPSFIKKSLNDYCFDEVLLRPVYQWGTMDEDVYWFKDVLNPMHPYHEEYLEILKHPALHDPRVYNFGGETSHEARPFPGSGAEKTAALDQCIAEKERLIAKLQEELQCCKEQSNHAEEAMNDQERRIRELRARIDTELWDLDKRLTDMQNSISFRIGRAVTCLPRKIRDGRKNYTHKR